MNKELKGEAGIGAAWQLSFRLLLYPRDFKSTNNPMIPATQIWNFSTLLSAFSRLSSSLSVRASAFGEPSTCSKVTATTTPVQMLMYGKEASNRKQEIDRQHYTIPNQRPKDKHCGKI